MHAFSLVNNPATAGKCHPQRNAFISDTPGKHNMQVAGTADSMAFWDRSQVAVMLLTLSY